MVIGGDLNTGGEIELLSFDPTRPVPECLQNLNDFTFGAYRNGAAAPLTGGKNTDRRPTRRQLVRKFKLSQDAFLMCALDVWTTT